MIDDGEEIHDGHHHAHGNQVVAFLCLREYCAVGHYGADVFPIIATIDTLLLHSHKTGNIQDNKEIYYKYSIGILQFYQQLHF